MSTISPQNESAVNTPAKQGVIFAFEPDQNTAQIPTSADETGFVADAQGTKEALNLTPNFGSERLI